MILFTENIIFDLCNPSPCGSNAECENGNCKCLENYMGDPYFGCTPECTVSSDCARHLICRNRKCTNPCPDICGNNALCQVDNHIPVCSCPSGYTGNPFVSCYIVRGNTPFIHYLQVDPSAEPDISMLVIFA